MTSLTPKDNSGATGRHKRRVRNYLLDTRFQLKYTGLLVAVALLLSAVLGVQLWATSRSVIDQSHQTLLQGQETVRRGQQMVTESKKVSDVVAMSITRDPEYADNPELAQLFKQDASERERKIGLEQQRLEQDAARLKQQTAFLAHQQTKTQAVLLVGLSVLVIAIGLMGIVFTHKIAGPVFKMKRLLREVGEGKLNLHAGLRKGDELQHFFDTFLAMIESLRQRREHDLKKVEQALSELEPEVDNAKLAALRELRDSMKRQLDM